MAEIKDQVESGLGALRQHIDEMRMKAHLLRMELREKQPEVVEDLEEAYAKTRERLETYREAGEGRAEEARASLKKAWTDLKTKIHEATAPDQEPPAV